MSEPAARYAIKKKMVMEYPTWGFRPGTPCLPTPINFLFVNGGLGDYLTWIQAILWLIKNATWVEGRLLGPDYFQEIAEYFLEGSGWPYWKYEKLKDQTQNGIPTRGPLKLEYESLNATGAHLIDCGFAYYCCQNPIPAGWNSYPRFDRARLPKLPDILSKVCKKYAVITTGQTSPSRRVKPEYWNAIIDHVIAKGFTPVFLGKAEVPTGNGGPIKTTYSDKVNYAKGIDLRDKTTLLEAASILNSASFVVGHDNGLLHLAGCTDTPIIFGYNLASPAHRRPRRNSGRVYDVTLSHADLACNHCQSKTNFVIGFVFHTCFYGDNLCLDLLFEKEGWRWKEQIDRCVADIDSGIDSSDAKGHIV